MDPELVLQHYAEKKGGTVEWIDDRDGGYARAVLRVTYDAHPTLVVQGEWCRSWEDARLDVLARWMTRRTLTLARRRYKGSFRKRMRAVERERVAAL